MTQGGTFDLGRVEDLVRQLLQAAGADIDHPMLAGTPLRVASTIAELFSGISEDPHAPLLRGDEVPTGTQLVALTDIEFRSVCAHHLLPFSGAVSIAYRPIERIVGIGSIIRALGILSSRPQLQEGLTQEFADVLAKGAGASGALVIMRARHSCIADRGPREADAELRTLAAAGDLRNGILRTEALTLLQQ